VRAINLKLVRDLAYLRGQAVAIGLVMACGVATFVMSLSMLDSLSGTLNSYYEQNRFAHVFAHLKRAPDDIAERIAEIPGVASVQTRVVERVILDMPGMSEPAAGKIISLSKNPHEGLNLLYLRAGRFPEGKRAREVLVSQRFAESHRLDPGDPVEVILNGRLETLRVVGIALSPEYIYLISPGSVLPENERYGVFWMARDELEAAFDMEGAFNDVVMTLIPGTNRQDVIASVDHLTDSYGGLGAYEREDQLSHKFMSHEIEELRAMTVIIPVIFLGVAAFLLNIVLSRLVTTQREQIAALKALGYSNSEIGRHYFGFVMLIAVIAVVVGTAAGVWMGRGLTAIYIEFFDFPTFQYTLKPRIIVLASIVTMMSASLGVFHALRLAVRLPPAEAMRPQAPMSFHPTIFERIGIHRMVPASIRMILRQLERRPIKAMLSIFGIALATAILIVGSYAEDATDYILNFQFNDVMQYDVDVVLADQTDDVAISTISSLPGVRSLEPYRSLAVRIRSAHRDRRIGIIGLTRSDGMHRLLDMNAGEAVGLSESGIVLSSILAQTLNIEVGDYVTIEALEGRRPTFQVEVSGLINDFSGLVAYMNMNEINRQMQEQNTIGGVYLLVDPTHIDSLYGELRDMPRVVAVNVKSSTVKNFRETIARNSQLMRPFLIGFATVIAFGVIYNSARISLSERSRDLATLRVLGFTRREITAIQLGELVIITGIAIPFGLVLGYFLSWFTSVSTESELFRIPFIIEPSTFAMAAIVVITAAAVSGIIVRRRLDKLDLVSVLKSRE